MLVAAARGGGGGRNSGAKQGLMMATALLSLLVLGANARVLQGDFIVLDDEDYVLNNPQVAGGLTVEGAKWAFRSIGYASNWHPLTWLSHMADVSLFGLHPMGHHLTSLLLHVLNALLLFAFLRNTTGALWRSFFATALFGVHPLRVESVAWVAERKDLLAAFFMLLALLAWVSAVRRRSRAAHVATFVLFALGLLSKATVITFPLVMLLLDWWPLGRSQVRSWRSPILGEKIPFVLLAAAAGWITLVAQQRGGATHALELPFWATAGNALSAYASYLFRALFPHNLAVFYPHPGTSLPFWKPLAAVLVLTAICWLGYRTRRRWPFVTVGWCWYLVTLFPVVGFVQVGWQATADRYTYLPLVGLFVVASWGLAEAAAPIATGQRLIVALAAAWLLTLSAASWVQAGYWRNSRTLFAHAIAVTEENWLAEYSLGVDLWRRRQIDEAEERFRNAVRLNPLSANAINNLGAILLEKGNVEEAAAALRRAVALTPGDPLLHFNYALSLERLDPEQAAREYREVIARKPEFQEARIRLAIVLRGIAQRAPSDR